MDFNIDKLKYIIENYKKNINKISFYQIYKWESLKCFQSRFNINEADFYSMLSSSLEKTMNLLNRGNFYPKKALLYFVENDAETVRDMFINLFNESINLSRRLEDFKTKSDMLLSKYKDEKINKHYQNLNSISMYLAFRFPGKYYMYDLNKFKKFANNIEYNGIYKGGDFEILQSYYKLCDGILEIVREDKELIALSRDRFKELNIYDNSLHLLVEDIIFTVEDMEVYINCNSYIKDDFLNDVYISKEKYDSLVRILNKKKNVIIQGCPGVGKTYLSKLLCYSIIGSIDEEKVKLIQFHPNYSYEDFVMGYRPSKNGFKIKYGIFYNFCKKAQNDPKNNYFLIIDEINRGNLSSIFGELLMSIESKYRGVNINLAYNDEIFNVPKNLYIIGIMNTADRSIAIMDYAFRRRFSFFTLEPAFNQKNFLDYIDGFNNKKLRKLIDLIAKLNEEIKSDFTLGEGFCIGHSYFFEDKFTDEDIRDVVEFEIIPLLKEYWFEDFEKIDKWSSKLLEVVEASYE